MIDFYIIATPIGNYDDISIRALKILKEADFVVCESEKEYKKLFSILSLEEKKYFLCNEHDESEAIELALPLLERGEKGVLISDCGTPLFEDPGHKFLSEITKKGFKVSSVPGANALMTALSLSPFKITHFYYAGRISPRNYERKSELTNLLKRDETIIIIETPYRLENIVSLFKEINAKRRLFIAYNLTMDNEELIWGYPDEIEKILKSKNISKGEFIVVVEEKR